MISSKLKTLYLLDVLREETDEQHRMSVPDLVAALAARDIPSERKGIYRDLEALREHGEDIIQTQTGYYLGRRAFDVSETRVLASAVQAAYFITEKRSRELVNKLFTSQSAYCADELRAQCNMGGVKCSNDEVLRAIDALNLAIAMHRQISFLYFKQDVDRRSVAQRGGKRFTVSPYALIWMMDRYYLVCNMDERDDLTHFRLDRMQRVRLEQGPWRHFNEVSDYKRTFDQADYVKKCVNMFGDRARIVTLRCDNSLAGELYDRFGTDIILTREDETRFTAQLNVAAGDGFLAWVGQWGAKAEIIAPQDVRDAMRDRIAAAARLYCD